jgi:hypothetical protein
MSGNQQPAQNGPRLSCALLRLFYQVEIRDAQLLKLWFRTRPERPMPAHATMQLWQFQHCRYHKPLFQVASRFNAKFTALKGPPRRFGWESLGQPYPALSVEAEEKGSRPLNTGVS